MTILLDIDGVMLPQTSDDIPTLADGFRAFTEIAAANLAHLVYTLDAHIVLTSNHRVSYTAKKWVELFQTRDIDIKEVAFINDLPFNKMMDRATEIKEWVQQHGANTNYVILDDDYSLNTLPEYIKRRWVATDPSVGFDDDAANKALGILLNNADISAT